MNTPKEDDRDACVLLDRPFTPDLQVWQQVAAQPPLARVDQHPAAVYLARLASGSRATMRASLDRIAELAMPGATTESFPWASLRYPHTSAIRARLADKYAPATTNRDLSALRQVLRECRRLGLMSAEDEAAATDIERVKGIRVPAGRHVEKDEIAKLFAACDPETAGGVRDAALLGVLYGGGLRRDEAAHLEVDDVDAVTGTLKVHGKGNKERLVPLGGGARRSVEAWLAVRGRDPGRLFLPIGKTGTVLRVAITRAMSGVAIYGILQRIRERAGTMKFSPHDLRRSFVGDLLDAGADISVVQKIVGHADPATTGRYDRRGERSKQAAADLLAIPR